MPVEHFKDREAYRRNLAYRHIHGIPYTATEAIVGGKKHKVKHSGNKKRRAIDARQRKKESHRKRSTRHKKA